MTPETMLKRQCISFMAWKNIFNFPIVQGFAAMRGIPDRIAVKDGKFYALEFKSKTGKLSEFQEQFKKQVEDAGGIYVEVRDVDDLVKLFGAIA